MAQSGLNARGCRALSARLGLKGLLVVCPDPSHKKERPGWDALNRSDLWKDRAAFEPTTPLHKVVRYQAALRVDSSYHNAFRRRDSLGSGDEAGVG